MDSLNIMLLFIFILLFPKMFFGMIAIIAAFLFGTSL